MLLYHYTAHEHMQSILKSGLNKGDVPIQWFGPGKNAVWLTTDRSPAEHGLGDAHVLSDDERILHSRLFQVPVPRPGFRYPNNRAVRITVRVRSTDRRLKRWLPWARRHTPAVVKGLVEAGGGMPKARTWFVYFGTIAPDSFQSVEYLTAAAPPPDTVLTAH